MPLIFNRHAIRKIGLKWQPYPSDYFTGWL